MSKVKDLPSKTVVNDDDLLYVVDDAAGTNGGRKVKKSDLAQSLNGQVTPSTHGSAHTENGSDPIPNATVAEGGLQSALDKAKLDSIEAGATADQNSAEVPHDPSDSTLTSVTVKDSLDELDQKKEPVIVKNTAFNKNFGTVAGTVVEGNDLRFSTAQRKQVKLSNPGQGEFDSIQAAINSITDASINKPYQVNLGPGVFNISQSIVMKPYIHVRGERDATVINITDESKPVIIGAPSCSLSQVSLSGSGILGTDVALVEYSGSGTNFGSFKFDIVNFVNCHTFFKCKAGSGSTAIVAGNNITQSGIIVRNGFIVEGDGVNIVAIENFITQFSSLGQDIGFLYKVSGPTNRLVVNNSGCAVVSPALAQNYVRIENGAIFNGQSIGADGFQNALEIPNIGLAPSVGIGSFLTINSVQKDILVNHPGTSGFINGSWRRDKSTVNINSPVAISHSDPNPTDKGFVVTGTLYQGANENEVLNLSKLSRTTATLGVIEGGVLTRDNINPLQINVSSGRGFILDSNNVVQEIFWPNTSLIVLANERNFISINENVQIVKESSLPENYEERLVLGRYQSNDSAVVLLENTQFKADHYGNKVEEYLREVLGTLFRSGCLISENSITPREIDITQGEYSIGTTELTVPASTSQQLAILIRDGLGAFDRNRLDTIIPNNEYDNNSGVIQTVPAGKYTKHIVMISQFEDSYLYNLIISQAIFDTLNDAVNAPLPQLPGATGQTFVTLAEIIMQEGVNNIVQINDIRPRLNFAAAAQSTVTDHGSLSGLDGNDHPQYLLRNGTLPMTGNFDLGGNDIINAGIIPGLTTAPPSTITPDQPNTEGVSPDKSRADHVHNIPTGVAIGLTAETGNTQGNANTFARSNHTHQISTGVASTQNAGQTNNAGTSADLARADHLHEIPTAAPSVDITPSIGNTEGVSTSFSRADHTHNVVTAAAVTINANTTNQQGTANTFSRSDHTHQISTGVVSQQLADQANAAGVSANIARADHIHNIPTAVPISTGTTNAQGVSNSFAKADHVHNTVLSNNQLHSSTIFTTTSGTYVPITGFTITPIAGTYLVISNLEHTNSNNNRINYACVFANNTQITTSEREHYVIQTGGYYGLDIVAIATVNGSQAIDVRVRTDQNTLTIKRRSLILVRIG